MVSKKIMIVLSLVAVSVVIAGIAIFASQDKSDEARLLPGNVEVVTRGKEVYAAECASCHGKGLEGEPNWRRRDDEGYLPAPPHDESGHTWHHSDRHLFELTKYGLSGLAGGEYRTRMPAYDDVLSDQDIVAVLSFIKSRWPENIRKRHDRLNAASKR